MPAILLLRSSDPTELLFWSALGFFAGIGLFVQGFRLLQRRRLILDTPFSKIRSASLGMVEVNGLAVGPFTLVAPITMRPCYYYRTQVFEWKQRGKNKQWVKVAGECMHVPFFLDDNTGRVLIDPRGAELDLHCDFKEEFNTSFFSSRDDAPGNVNLFLSRHGVVTSNKIKVEEFCIKPKNALFVLGTLTENPGLEVTPQAIADAEPVNSFTAQGFSLSLSFSGSQFNSGSPDNQAALQQSRRDPEVIHLSPRVPASSGGAMAANMTQQQKVAAALLKAGISSPDAWKASGASSGATGVPVMVDPSALSEAPANTENADPSEAAKNHGFDPRPPVVLGKGSNNKNFLISWRSQQEVARSLGWKCTLMIWGGPVLMLFSLYVFLAIEHLL